MSERMPTGFGGPESREVPKSSVQKAIEAFVEAENKEDTEGMEQQFQRLCKIFKNYEKGKYSNQDVDAAFNAFVSRGKGEEIEKAIISNFTIEKRNGKEIFVAADPNASRYETPAINYYTFSNSPQNAERQRYIDQVNSGGQVWALRISTETDENGNALKPEYVNHFVSAPVTLVIEKHQQARLLGLGTAG